MENEKVYIKQQIISQWKTRVQICLVAKKSQQEHVVSSLLFKRLEHLRNVNTKWNRVGWVSWRMMFL